MTHSQKHTRLAIGYKIVKGIGIQFGRVKGEENMTREEALAKIKKLEDYIQELDKPIGYKEDKLFLLSIEEYEEYKNEIPHINTWWWLRTQAVSYAMCVNVGGSVNEIGSSVDNDRGGVRPALKYKKPEKCENGCYVSYMGYPFTVIDADKHIAIADVPITFDKFDDESNIYETSYIREYLNHWKGIYND